VMIGLPLMTLSLITGALWPGRMGLLLGIRSKQNMSAVTWVVYAAYFYTERGRLAGRKASC